MTYSEDTSQVTSVWSAHGHRFMSDDAPYESCLTCGAMYQLLAHADDPSTGAYLATNGDAPQPCTGDTSTVHGYPGERDDDAGNTDHDCNCVACA